MDEVNKKKTEETISNQSTLPDEDGNCPEGTRPVEFIDPNTGERRIECVPDDE